VKVALLGIAAWLLLPAACDRPTAAEADPAFQFPPLSGRVVDQADLLSPGQERRLTAASAAVEREVGPQFVIVTVDSLRGHAIEDYGVQLGRTWGIGHPDRDDGVILLVAPNERKVRIEVGYGLENRVTDPFAAKVLRERVLPRFREDDMAGGIIAGSEAIVARLRSRQTDREIAVEDRLVS
jgi:uncharacterized protein